MVFRPVLSRFMEIPKHTIQYDFLYENVDPWAHYPMESPVRDLTFSYKIGKNQSGFKRHRSHHISPNMVIEAMNLKEL